MTASAALARAEAAGLRFRPTPGGGVRVECAAPPPPELLAELRHWREDVARLVAQRYAATPPAPVDWRALPYGPERGEGFAAALVAPGACRSCAGRRWWRGEGGQAAPRCMACHPPPPGLPITTTDA